MTHEGTEAQTAADVQKGHKVGTQGRDTRSGTAVSLMQSCLLAARESRKSRDHSPGKEQFRRPAGQNDSGPASQRTILAEAEFRLLLDLKGRDENQAFPSLGQPLDGMCSFPPSYSHSQVGLVRMLPVSLTKVF